jgi:putative sigma-54 modulation protein
MRLELTGRQVSVTPALRRLVSRHVGRLERLLNDNAVSAQVVLTAERQQFVTDITLHTRGDHILSGMAAATTWPLSIRLASDKLSQQARKVKEKWTARRRRAERPVPSDTQRATPTVKAGDSEADMPAFVRIRPAARRLSLAAALARLGDTLENYVVFTHEATGRLVVLVRRRDGRVGLIELEA